jgi:acyl-CoA synthetase (AMP-forming)/AMP-acid ligase II
MDNVTTNENKKVQNIPKILKTMQQSDIRPQLKIDPEIIATYILTSGTTGLKEKKNSQKYLIIFIFKANLKLQCYLIQIYWP